ncbi:phospho-N-acetylmuramoyl-pentapeptide-transferase [bacterium]|nr:phospho-N-acetylmuramoyl-pentapeptide-transferase [bacterium]
MIYLLADLLQSMNDKLSFLRVLEYISVRSIGSVITTFLMIYLLGPFFIRYTYKQGLKDKQRDFDPHLAKSKHGTPTMGGVLIVFSVCIAMLLWGDWGNSYLWIVMSSLLFFAFIGSRDDLAKVRGGHADAGMSRNTKLLLQTFYGLGLGIILYLPATTPFPHFIAETVGIPFVKPAIHGGIDIHLYWLYIPFCAFVVVAVSNAVNLLDGLDGLAAGTCLPTVIVYGVFAYILGNVNLSGYLLYPSLSGVHELVVFSSAMIGALIGFLWYNGYPAEMFMGDTGSLAIGGVLSVLMLLTKQEFLFLIAGALFIYVNLTHVIGERIGLKLLGRRIFFRTPIHHSFEHRGFSETKVVLRFSIVALILALLAISTLKLR